MNTKYIFPGWLTQLVVSALLLGACAPAAVGTDPVTVVKAFYQAFNDKDLEKARSLIAEDYVMNDPSGTYDRDAAMIQWQAVIDSGITFNPTNFVDTGNGRVTSCFEVFQNGNLLDKGCGSVTRVHDGKIVFDGLESGEPMWIVQKLHEAINTGDIEAAMAYVADDIECRGAVYLTGKESYRSVIQTDINSGSRAEISELRVKGDTVTYNWEAYSKDGFFQARGTETLQIKDGLIVSCEVEVQ
jgi:ketosteroid isomerase-like protein